jgi:hypothetical protein
MTSAAKTAVAGLTPREKMTALVNAQPLTRLCASLLMLAANPEPTEAERLTHAVIIDAICKKSPAAEAAFEAWAERVDDERTAAAVIVAAVKGA